MIDNREAAAYLLFSRFNCSRDEALSAIDELGRWSLAFKRWSGKRYRSRRGLSVPREAALGGVVEGKAQNQNLSPGTAKGEP